MSLGYIIADTTNNADSETNIDTLSSMSIGVLATVADVDLKSTGQTILYTVPASSSGCIITDVMLMITASDTATVGPTVEIGISPSYNEWLGSTALTTMTTLFKTKSLNSVATGREPLGFGPNDIIKFDITVGATATSLRATIILLGYNL